jgi:hypothetical protein
MKRLFIPLGLLAAVALPATAAAAPTSADKREGKKECRQLQRVVETRANFVQIVKLEAKANRRNAFGRCVKVRAADATAERRTAFKQAKEACAALRPARGAAKPAAPGSQGNKPADPGSQGSKPADPGAYGRCVSAAARSKAAALDAEQREDVLNPARTCRGKQEADLDAFKLEFPGKNGFGKCVSKEARTRMDDDDPPTATS